MRDNSNSITHLPFVFMAKLDHFFQNLAAFSQNSINTNKAENNNQTFNVKQVTIAVKLMSKFFKQMTEHIEDSSVPKGISPFARAFFVKQSGKDALGATSTTSTDQKTDAKQPAAMTKGVKLKSDGTNPNPMRNKKKILDKSMAMRIFHLKKGTPVTKALPGKSNLKDSVSICLDFCCHERKCKYPHALCRNGKHYTNWKNIPKEDKTMLLSHMNETGLLWFDKDTMKNIRLRLPVSILTSLVTPWAPNQNRRRVRTSASVTIHLDQFPQSSNEKTLCPLRRFASVCLSR